MPPIKPTFKSSSSFSLLIVEDDQATCELMTRMVAESFPDCTIYTAGNGVLGALLFERFAPEIVITDINLPVMDGIEMVRKIRSINLNAKCIVITAYNDKITFDKFKDIGISAYLVKPLDFRGLFAAIEKCIGEIHLNEEWF
jgi:YesN/AraC family two-component response regulator